MAQVNGSNARIIIARESVFKTLPVVLVHDCESAWTAGTNVTATADTAIFKAGTKSCKLVVADPATAGQLLAYSNFTLYPTWFR